MAVTRDADAWWWYIAIGVRCRGDRWLWQVTPGITVLPTTGRKSATKSAWKPMAVMIGGKECMIDARVGIIMGVALKLCLGID